MQFKRDKTELHQMQVMPLRYKIRMTADRIESWYAHYAHYSLEWADNGPPGVYMSFSGGKDSTVLLHILKNHCMAPRKITLKPSACCGASTCEPLTRSWPGSWPPTTSPPRMWPP